MCAAHKILLLLNSIGDAWGVSASAPRGCGAMAESRANMARGRKTGGRKKGSRNRATTEARAAAEATGILPLDYICPTMSDTVAPLLQSRARVICSTASTSADRVSERCPAFCGSAVAVVPVRGVPSPAPLRIPPPACVRLVLAVRTHNRPA